MFGTFAITALLASTLVGTAYADVTPDVPGPGVVYKVGGTCHTEWIGDTASPTAWKNMAIELMTGDNFNMVHLTTVATGLDGTKDGKFDHPCPDVNPYSAIYFYQYSAPGASAKQWTTRFAIASASGQTTPPSQATQPNTGAAIPWGTGQLVDASSATPPPDFDGGSSVAPTTTPPAGNNASSSSADAPAVTPAPGPVTTATSTPGSSKMVTVTTSNVPTGNPQPGAGSANTTSSGSGSDNGAMDLDVKLWKSVVALGTSAMVFALLL